VASGPGRAGLSLGAGLLAGGSTLALGAPLGATLLTALIAAAGTWAASPDRQSETIAPPPESSPVPADLSALIVDAIDDPILLVDRQIVVQANAAARSLLGVHVVGEDIRLAIRHPAAAAVLGGGESGPVDLTGLGEPDRRWELTASPLTAARRLVRLRDRSDTHAAERMRVDFVANASHELRTPLATLLGFIETLEDANEPQDAAVRLRFLKIMFGEAKRMQQLIDDLMSLSRIEADRYSPPQTPIDLASLIEQVSDELGAGQAADGARIQLQLENDVPQIVGDASQLSQLLHNLIGNALKYGRAGTPVRVALTRNRRGMARLSISDEGDGIPAEHLPRITERFYRVDPSRSRAVGGTGLGLAIVKHIVERHRGRLTINSVVGQGTVVMVLLPPVSRPVSSN
jgi:two-component system phosphate regulon sensor histidine kinase PhoR